MNEKETILGTANSDAPKEEGFYWATSIQRKGRKTRPGDYGQRGGLRWIVRVLRLDADEEFRVQTFGGEMLHDVRDYRDWSELIGKISWPKKNK